MKTTIRLTILFALMIFVSSSFGQDLRESLFKDADKKMEEARAAALDLLSPTKFQKALEDFTDAEEEFTGNANLNKIKAKLHSAIAYINEGMKNSEMGNLTFRSVLKARNDARKADASKYASELWQKAEEQFKEAGEELEDGDMQDAQEEGKLAEEIYRNAELAGIKSAYLDATWRLIETAKNEDAEDFTPMIYAKAIALVTETEKELNANRYDADLPRSLAMQAQYEANHTLFLTRFIKDFENTDKTMEQLLLESEKPLLLISSAFDYEAKFDKSTMEIAQEIFDKISTIKNENQKMNDNIAELNQQLEIMKEELGGITQEKSELAEKMQKLADLKAKYDDVGSLFTKDEALVLKDGEDIVIRMVGLNFEVGKSTIEAENFSLLTKVQKAIRLFTGNQFIVEGHTDSYGSDEKNMQLSEERANSVRQYLLANMNLDSYAIGAMGYGETKPIASNETKEGRAKNRRIDLLIKGLQ